MASWVKKEKGRWVIRAEREEYIHTSYMQIQLEIKTQRTKKRAGTGQKLEKQQITWKTSCILKMGENCNASKIPNDTH